MITEEQFAKMQLILGKNGRARGLSKSVNKYNGLFKCGECGYTVIPEPLKMKKIKSTGETRFYKYWHCSHKSPDTRCSQKSITEKEIESALEEFLSNIEINDDFMKWSMRYIQHILNNETNSRNLIGKNLESQHKEVMRKIDELAELFFDPANSDKSVMTVEEFKIRKVELTNQRTKFEKAMNKLSKRQDNVLEVLTYNLDSVKGLVTEFNIAEPDRKREILIDVGRTMIIKDRKVYIEPKLAVLEINKVKDQVSLNPEWLELNPSNSDKDIQLFEEICTVWSGDLLLGKETFYH